MKLYEQMFKELGCTCYVPDKYLGDIITEDPNCKYHNWLEKMLADGEDIELTV